MRRPIPVAGKGNPSRIRPFFLIFPCIAFSSPGGARAQDAPGVDAGEARTSLELLQAGDQSARSGRLAEALGDWKRAFERRFAGFREVPFAFPVDAEYLDRASLRSKLLEEFRKEMPDEKLLAEGKAMACLGFFGFDLDLKGTLMDLLMEQVAGFYDPDTKRLYLIRQGGDQPEKRKWWEKLMGSGGPDLEEQKMILVHEMSHALMDQHHDLFSMHRSVEHDDDLELAVNGLIEGEATLCMMVGALSDGDKSLLRAPPGFMSAYMNLIKPFLGFAAGSGFRKAPPILRESLLFPYLNGLSFCMTLTSPQGSWKPVDAAFSDPPTSTEQILHPEKYLRDTPLAVSFPELSGSIGPGWQAVYTNVLGEFQIRILLSGKIPGAQAEKAAEGWDGDFYRIYEKEKGGGRPEMLLVWASVWDSPDDAREYREAMERFLALRLGKEPSEISPGQEELRKTWHLEGRRSEVLSRADTVWVFQDVPEDLYPEVQKRALQLKREPKVFQLRRARPAVEFPEERRLRTRRL